MLAEQAGALTGLATTVGYTVLFGVLLWVLVRVSAWLRRIPCLDLQGRWVVVTGCDSGIGQGVLAALSQCGAKVIACCLTNEGARAAMDAGAAWAPCADLKHDAQILELAREINSRSGSALWGLVHTAGTVLPGFVDYQPASHYREVMSVNFHAPVILTQQLLPALRLSRGRVVLVSSVDGIVSLPGNAPYDASKFALEAYADALRVELSFCDVSVSVINPSTMRTPMAREFFPAHRRTWQEMARQSPEGPWRQLWPEEWLERYVELNTAQLDRIAEDPRGAVDDIVHALEAVRPRLRYLSGRLAKTLFYLLWLMPEHWSFRFKRLTVQPPPPRTPK